MMLHFVWERQRSRLVLCHSAPSLEVVPEGAAEPVLALWREIAWKEGRPDRKFEPTAEFVLAAEARVGESLKKAHSGR